MKVYLDGDGKVKESLRVSRINKKNVDGCDILSASQRISNYLSTSLTRVKADTHIMNKSDQS